MQRFSAEASKSQAGVGQLLLGELAILGVVEGHDAANEVIDRFNAAAPLGSLVLLAAAGLRVGEGDAAAREIARAQREHDRQAAEGSMKPKTA